VKNREEAKMADDIRDLTAAITDISNRLARLEGQGRLSPVADPAPWQWPVPRWPFPFPFPFPQPDPPWFDPRRPPIGDPPPFDIGRLSQVQLEAQMHELSAQKVRIDAALADLQKQLAGMKRK
jgi:hypothetical protein